ncbi:hypothetical protein ACQR0Y_25165 [Bradyrhizobium oligotrophicum]|uniref:hypothetical protein n=1 Tax=Bradyrhizobium oligotrophicum TaxID=44255 RepID=UPI003EB879C3
MGDFDGVDALRTAIASLLVTAALLVSARAENDNLRQVVSNLKACVRTYAPTVKAAGFRTADDAVNLFIERCGPRASFLAPENVGAIPPGLLRDAVRDEWSAFIGDAQPR